MIPAHERGMRRFCLWAIAMAVKTLAKINRDRQYHDPASTKITRNSLRRIILLCNASVHSDALSELLFTWLTRKLPAPEPSKLVAEVLNVIEQDLPDDGRPLPFSSSR